MIPNLLTLARLAVIPLVIWFILEQRMEWAFWLFVAAGLTDALDGFLARMLDARTWIGGLLDPLADKALVISTYIALFLGDHLPLWLILLVVLRDGMILIGGVIRFLLGTRYMPPLFISKINTAMQISLPALALAFLGPLGDLVVDAETILPIMIMLVAVTTILSGIAYVRLMAVQIAQGRAKAKRVISRQY